MSATLTIAAANAPLDVTIVANLAAAAGGKVTVASGPKTELVVGSTTFKKASTVLRFVGRLCPRLYGDGPLQATEVDHWVDFSGSRLSSKVNKGDVAAVCGVLDTHLQVRTFMLGNDHGISLADVSVFAALYSHIGFQQLLSAGAVEGHVNLSRWIAACLAEKAVADAVASVGGSKGGAKKEKTADQGKFVELEGAEMGKVVTRFPPEASGYLHIGHAKAAFLNEYFARKYKGKLLMRFDDTNPAKESSEYEKVILEDLELLGIKYDQLSHTSDHFDLMIELVEKMIKEGNAYADDQEKDVISAQRMSLQPSPCREYDAAKSLSMWEEMKAGSEFGRKCTIRAKIDYKSDNGALRDPTLYRCKPEPHVRTGTKYNVYPLYDFACPIVDSVEGVTHALRTTEYHDRDVQYAWICEKLGIRAPKIWDFSRLNMKRTVMSKRQLTWFVDEKKADGWNDPRFPTVRGILRHGETVAGLREFILGMGASKSAVQMEWDKFWAINKKVIDPAAARYTALEAPVTLTLSNVAKPEEVTVALHPKNPEVGTKQITRSPSVLVEAADLAGCKEGDTVTLLDWGNVVLESISTKDGKVTAARGKLNLADKSFSKTMKLTWIAPSEATVDVTAMEFTPLINIDYVPKGHDIGQYLSAKTKHELKLVGEAPIGDLQAGTIIEVKRKGFFICDQAAVPGLKRACHLIYIPSGANQMFIADREAETAAAPAAAGAVSAGDLEALKQQIKAQKATIEGMRKGKQDKRKIKEAQAVLAEMEAKVKATGSGAAAAAPPAAAAASAGDPEAKAAIMAQIDAQGLKIRELKAAGGDVKAEVATLLSLKEQYKIITGEEFPKAGGQSSKKDKKKATKKEKAPTEAPAATPVSSHPEAAGIMAEITAAGNTVRDLKAAKADKAETDAALATLLAAKKKYKDVTGEEVPGTGGGKRSKAAKQAKQAKPAKEAKAAEDGKKTTKLGMDAKKEEDLAEWYQQVITKSEMIEYYDVSGCYVLRPWSYAIWEQIQSFFDGEIKKLGVENSYFPCFVSEDALEKEKEHIADFAPEVAWVTRSGSSELAKPIAIRPTSETVIYPAYAKWVQSHRDLPLKLNQWCNVVRWEFKQPTPFLRTREFLWQEGHTAYATKEPADVEVMQILDLYRRVYEEILALPVVPGRKTEKEKFAGGDYTTTVEAYIPAAGRAIQGATSHHLGQNFSKMFHIEFEDPTKPNSKEKLHAFQNSWGLTTRTIGVMVMVHGDDKGLVLPPRGACVQVIVIPVGITVKTSKADADKLLAHCAALKDTLLAAGIRVRVDDRQQVSPGWKFSHWELKGVPLRVEIGPRDLEKGEVVVVRRDNGVKASTPAAGLEKHVAALLETVQADMFAKAKADRDARLKTVHSWQEFMDGLAAKCLLFAPFCGGKDCEGEIKKSSTADPAADPTAPSMGAKSLCIPFEQEPIPEGKCTCINPSCGKPADKYTMFGRSY